MALIPPKSINSNESSNSGGLTIESAQPNPFTAYFTIIIKSEKESVADFMLTNMNGTTISSSKININKGETKYTFNEGSNLSSGAYVVNLTQENEEPVSIKIIKK